MHIDEWLDSPTLNNRGENYAKFVINYMRMPAWCQFAFKEWTEQFKLFCRYQGKIYRVTGASRLGDLWLKELPKNHKDDDLEQTGYNLRVDVAECSDWGPDRDSIYQDIQPNKLSDVEAAEALLKSKGYKVIK